MSGSTPLDRRPTTRENWAPVGDSDRLVTGGAFQYVRHPIYTGLVGMSLGVVLMVPTPLAIAALAVFLVTVELEARVVEEPFLLKTQPAYEPYAARTGRFLPGVGRLRETR